MRNKLGDLQKERELFEAKKKELAAEMEKGKATLGDIRKGLKNKGIGVVASAASVAASADLLNVASGSAGADADADSFGTLGTESSTMGFTTTRRNVRYYQTPSSTSSPKSPK